MAGGAKAKAAIVRKQPPPPKSVGTLDGKVVEGSEYANMLAADNNKYAASKAEGTLDGKVVEGSEYANMLAADRAAANNKYAASKAEGFKNGGVVIDSSYYRFLLKGLIDSNHEFRRKLDEEEEASRREYTNLPEDRKELVAPPNFEYAYLVRDLCFERAAAYIDGEQTRQEQFVKTLIIGKGVLFHNGHTWLSIRQVRSTHAKKILLDTMVQIMYKHGEKAYTDWLV